MRLGFDEYCRTGAPIGKAPGLSTYQSRPLRAWINGTCAWPGANGGAQLRLRFFAPEWRVWVRVDDGAENMDLGRA